MSFSTPTPRRRAPPRRTAQQAFDTSASTTTTPSAMPSTSTSLAPSTSFTPRAATPSALKRPFGFPSSYQQDESMTDHDGTVSVAAPSSVFAGSVLSELPDDDEGAGGRPSRKAIRPKEVWMNDGRVEVWRKNGLPSAVQQVLDASDLYTSPLSASFSEQTGFASLLTHSALYVWSYLKSNSTLYTFPLPQSISSHPSLLPPQSHALLIPSASAASREPSVLIVSPSGEIRFWDSLSSALVDNGMRFTSSSAISEFLEEEETVDGLCSAGEGLGAVITGGKGGVWKIDVSYPGGKTQINVAPFPKSTSGGFLGFFRSSSTSTSATSSGLSQRTLVLPLGNSQLLLLSPQSILQTCAVTVQGSTPTLTSSSRLLPAVLVALRAEERQGLEMSLEFHDMKLLSEGEVGVLVSFEEAGMLEGGRRSAIIGVVKNSSGDVKVTRVLESSTRIDLDPRPLPQPSFIPLLESQQALLVLPSSLLLVSLSTTKSFEEHLLLKDSARNAFLGVGRLGGATPDEVGIVMKTGGFAALKVAGQATVAESGKDADTKRLKSRLEQAIFFGTNPSNPLSFDLTPSLPGSLLNSTAQLSAQITSSSLPLLPPILDTRTSLAARLQSLTHLVELIGRCGLMGKLSAGARRGLMADAERLRAGGDSWAYLEGRMNGEDLTGTPRGLLMDAIALFMTRDAPSSPHSPLFAGEDPLRLFFRTRIRDLGKVLEIVGSHVVEALDRSTDVDERSKWLSEANRIYLVVYKAALRHREEYSTKYGLAGAESSHSTYSEPWTTTTLLLSTLQVLVEQTDDIIFRRTREYGSVLDEAGGVSGETIEQAMQRELKDMLGELAAALLATFEERIRYLLSVLESAVGEGISDREAVELKDRYLVVRPKVILGLVRVNHSDRAYELAEHHRDFRALVELCNHPSVGSPARTQYYIEKFREDFAFELYQWYIKKGKMKTLLTQDEVYAPLLLSFLDSSDNSRIAWIQDIVTKRYDHAAQSLLKESESEPKLAEKQLMLSIGKLCQVASLSGQTNPSEAARKRLDGVDDRLDLISVHERLRTLFQQAAGSAQCSRGMPPSVEANVEAATNALALNLADYSALRSLFVRLGSSLMMGRTLRPEDLIDLLVLKANQAEDQVGDYATALDVLSRARDIPSGRAQMALLSIWRRVYIRDNWAALSTNNLTDQQLEEILRETALFNTLSILRDIAPQTAPLAPSDVVMPASHAPPPELAARCADDSADTIGGLWQDLQTEDRTLQSYLQEGELEVGKRGLEVWAAEVMRLVGQDETQE